MLKRILIILLIIILSLVIIIAGAGTWWWFLNQKPLTIDGEPTIYKLQVPSGMSIKSVANILEEEGLIRSSKLFYYLARHNKIRLKAGTYEIHSTMDIAHIFSLLESGQSEYLKISIPEGLTLSKIGSLLEKNGVVSQSEFVQAAKNPDLLKEYNIPAESFEGYLFPDTYHMNPQSSGEEIVKKFVTTFFKKIEKIESLASLNNEQLFNIVRLASIIEREYRVADEAPLIASVFTNRLENDIGLYSCATIEYIITEINGLPHPEIITNKDLKIDNPYNTYKWAGLPPGPISNPGLVALKAAAEPADSNYLYFRVVDPQSGRHHFSVNFEDHVDAGQLYTKKAAGS